MQAFPRKKVAFPRKKVVHYINTIRFFVSHSFIEKYVDCAVNCELDKCAV